MMHAPSGLHDDSGHWLTGASSRSRCSSRASWTSLTASNPSHPTTTRRLPRLSIRTSAASWVSSNLSPTISTRSFEPAHRCMRSRMAFGSTSRPALSRTRIALMGANMPYAMPFTMPVPDPLRELIPGLPLWRVVTSDRCTLVTSPKLSAWGPSQAIEQEWTIEWLGKRCHCRAIAGRCKRRRSPRQKALQGPCGGGIAHPYRAAGSPAETGGGA